MTFQPNIHKISATRSMFFASLTLILFFLASAMIHLLLQNEQNYSKCSRWLKTYEVEFHDDGSWAAKKAEKPFMRIEDGKLLSWDANLYNHIRQHLYDPHHSWVGEYAFFPLFPLFWKGLNVSPVGICIVNLFLFIAGATLIVYLFRQRISLWMYLLVVCMPFIVIYAIPYSEALFFLATATGIAGVIKGKYWLYFAGFFIASMTRAAGNILLIAWLITDILSTIATRKGWKGFLHDVTLHLIPIVAGVFLVMIFMHLRGGEHWFEYALAQKQWNKELSFPSWPLSDWSQESACVTQPLLFALFIPALIWLTLFLLRCIKFSKDNSKAVDFDGWQCIRLLSMLFFVGNIILALMTQKGCMYSQARLLTCTPFFLFLLLDMARENKTTMWTVIMTVFLVVAIAMCHKMLLRPATLGLVITLLLIVLVFYNQWMHRWLKWTLLCITIALNLFWTAYLFNCFMNRGWIFT